MIPAEKAPTASDSLLRILRKIVPWLFYTGVHTFRVQSAEQEDNGAQSGGALALEPSGTRTFKAEPIVLQWSTGGTVLVPKVGSEVGIVFLDHDPTRPAIVAWQALSLAGGRPDVVDIDADSAVRVGRHAAVTTVGAPNLARFVARADVTDGNFVELRDSLDALTVALAANVPPIVWPLAPAVLPAFPTTAVDKLKSE